MSQQTPYIGCKISLISMLDIRYEGILYSVNSEKSTIALSKVRSFGTEDRQTVHIVPPRDEVYEYIIFKATDIKDLVVCSATGPDYDPAIISVSSVPEPPQEQKQPEKKEPEASSNVKSPPIQPWSSSQASMQPSAPMGQLSARGGFGQGRRGAPPVSVTTGAPSTDNDAAVVRNAVPRQSNFHNNHNNASSRGSRGPRTFHHNNQPAAPAQRLKFESDFDFEEANEKFKEQLGVVVEDLSKANIADNEESTENVERSEASTPVQAPANAGETFYDKKTSFFDNISCESLEKTEGKNTRPDWKKERMTNQETFGHSAVRSLTYRRGPRGFVGGGHHRYQNQNHFSNNFNGGGNRNNYRNYHQNQQSQQQQRLYGGTFGAPPSGYHHRPYAGGNGRGGNKPNGW